MIRTLFVNKTALEKGAVKPKDIPLQKTKKLGVLGAGMMGSGIAYVAALSGIEVVLIDANEEKASKGKGNVEKILLEGIKRKKTTPDQMEKVLGRGLCD